MFAGIEGGGTGSRIVLLNPQGKILANVEGPSLNHWQIGMEECVNRVESLLKSAMKVAGDSTVVSGLGLAMSGADTDTVRAEMAAAVLQRIHLITDKVTVVNDTVGSVATYSPGAGLVIISGTGSNCCLIDANGKERLCGGWGHALGDEGGAWWIAHSGIKTVFNHEDGLIPCLEDISFVKTAMLDHFQLTDRRELLNFLYKFPNKAKEAALCPKLAQGAVDGDALCQSLFNEAGRLLARHVRALLPHAPLDMLRDLRLLCVGGVWKSWNLLKSGFLQGLQQSLPGDIKLAVEDGRVTLLKPEVTSAVGAAVMVARRNHLELDVKYEENVVEIFSGVVKYK